MATQASVQAAIFRGYGKAAAVLGAPFGQFRATGPNGPVTGTPFGTVQAAFDRDPKFSFKQPADARDPALYGLFDGTNVVPGDYLVHATQGTFFVSGYEPNKPMLCIRCNRSLSFARPVSAPASGYSARQAATDLALASGWPASVLQGTKGEQNPVGLPSDVRAPWLAIMLPAIPGVTLDYSDLATDDLGRRFVLSNVELTSLGYRITATYADA